MWETQNESKGDRRRFLTWDRLPRRQLATQIQSTPLTPTKNSSSTTALQSEQPLLWPRAAARLPCYLAPFLEYGVEMFPEYHTGL